MLYVLIGDSSIPVSKFRRKASQGFNLYLSNLTGNFTKEIRSRDVPRHWFNKNNYAGLYRAPAVQCTITIDPELIILRMTSMSWMTRVSLSLLHHPRSFLPPIRYHVSSMLYSEHCTYWITLFQWTSSARRYIRYISRESIAKWQIAVSFFRMFKSNLD